MPVIYRYRRMLRRTEDRSAWIGRFLATLPVVVLIGCLIAGCSSSGSSSTARSTTSPATSQVQSIDSASELPPPASSQPVDIPSTAPASTEAPPAPSPLHLAGTITQSDDQSTTISETWRVGQPQYGEAGQPPAEVLSACGFTDQAQLSISAFIPAEVTIAYTKGALPQTITIAANELTNIGEATVAVQTEQGWQCGATSPLNLSFEPGASGTSQVWILAQVLTNAAPRVTKQEEDSWVFISDGAIQVLTQLPDVTAAGPGCAPRGQLYMYRTGPRC